MTKFLENEDDDECFEMIRELLTSQRGEEEERVEHLTADTERRVSQGQ